MNETVAMLLSDGYKQVHAEQYPKNTTKLVSYLTPRKSRLKEWDKMILFGVQAFCKNYLIKYFNENFFDLPEDEVIADYKRIVDVMLGEGNYGVDKVRALHKLGYLPIEISALPEGTRVPMHVPCIQVTNTHPDFAWVVQFIESLMSSEIWKPCIHANVGYSYRQIVNKHFDKSVDDDFPRSKAISDFGFRGMSCMQEATKASASWLLSFSGTATIPAIPYLEKAYNCDCTKELVGTNAISTEHSVMASNFAVDGDEISFVRRLLTEIYPNASFSMVSDTYDYWNMVDNILPQVKDEILAHNGKLLIRPDSGDIIEISVKTIEHLWNIFGGTVNSKGYKVLDPHIGCVYGDGVTQQRADIIYTELENRGFAANNIVFGAGSFSFNCIETEDGLLAPFTRDTFSVAIKATHGVIDGKEVFIFKDPKTDKISGQNFKKSQKGLCYVYTDVNNQIQYKDELTFEDMNSIEGNMLQPIFRDGQMVRECTLQEIRSTLHEGGF